MAESESQRYFSKSTEILWELARRYEIVEKATAAVLYRKLNSPPQSAIAQQAAMELSKFQFPIIRQSLRFSRIYTANGFVNELKSRVDIYDVETHVQLKRVDQLG